MRSIVQDRIGDDLILVSSKNYWNPNGESFIADATNAVFFTRGSASISVNMKEYRVEAPAMILFMQGMIVRMGERSADSKFDAMILSNRFTREMLSDANVSVQLRDEVMNNPVFALDGSRNLILFHYLLSSLVNSEDNPFRLQAVKHLTMTLFYGFALSRKEEAKMVLSHKESLYQVFEDLVRENHRTRRSVSWYASAMCLTPKYLSQTVKDVSGKTALAIIDEFIVVEAKALLMSTNLTIDQVGEKLGFNSQSLFGKYFKRVCGVSPRAYRTSVK